MVQLPADVRLFLQGRLPLDDGRSLWARIDDMGLRERVVVLPPYKPEDAVREAAVHDVGLCLERPGPKNHELTGRTRFSIITWPHWRSSPAMFRAWPMSLGAQKGALVSGRRPNVTRRDIGKLKSSPRCLLSFNLMRAASRTEERQSRPRTSPHYRGLRLRWTRQWSIRRSRSEPQGDDPLQQTNA